MTTGRAPNSGSTGEPSCEQMLPMKTFGIAVLTLVSVPVIAWAFCYLWSVAPHWRLFLRIYGLAA